MTKPNTSNLRKMLEQPSRKTRYSTDLRRSLGRRSVGDVSRSDLAAIEQVSISSNESFHLNPDSNVLDPDLNENPEWYKYLGDQAGNIIASNESVDVAFQNQRPLEFGDDSNVENITMDRRDVRKFLKNDSIVVNQSFIDQRLKRNGATKHLSSTLDESHDGSLDIPKRKRTALGKRSKSIYKRDSAAFRDALNDSSIEENQPKQFQTESRNSRGEDAPANKDSQPTRKTVDSPDLSLEIPKRKRVKGQRTVRRRDSAAYREAFGQALIDSSIEENVPINNAQPPDGGDKNSNRNVESQPSTEQTDAPDISLEIPKRKRTALLKGQRTVGRRDSAAYREAFGQALIDSSIEENVAINNAQPPDGGDKNSNRYVESQPITEQTDAPDISLEIPKRKRTALVKGRRTVGRRDSSAYREALGQAFIDSSTEGGNVAGNSGDSNTNGDIGPQPTTQSTDSPNMSLEIPKRKRTALVKGQRTVGRRDSSAYREALGQAFIDSSIEKNVSENTAQAPADGDDNPNSDSAKENAGHPHRSIQESAESMGNPLNHTLNHSLPLGAEAINMRDATQEDSSFPIIKVEEMANTTLPHPSKENLRSKPPEFGDISIVSSRLSVTDKIRGEILGNSKAFGADSFLSAECVALSKSPIHQDGSLRNRSLDTSLRTYSMLSRKSGRSIHQTSVLSAHKGTSLFSVSNSITSGSGKHTTQGGATDHVENSCSPIIRDQMNVTSSSGGISSPKSAVLMIGAQNMVETPLSSKESFSPRLTRRVLKEHAVPNVASPANGRPTPHVNRQKRNKECLSDGELSDTISTASTLSIPSTGLTDIALGLDASAGVQTHSSVKQKGLSSVGSSTRSVDGMQLCSIGSDSVFESQQRMNNVEGSTTGSQQTTHSTSSSGKTQSESTGAGSFAPQSNANTTWSENPYVELSHNSVLSGGNEESEPTESELSSIEREEAPEEYGASGESEAEVDEIRPVSVEKNNSFRSSKADDIRGSISPTSAPTPAVETNNNLSRSLTHSIFSPPRTVPSLELGQSQIKIGPQRQRSHKEINQQDLEKMRSSLQKWMYGMNNDKNTTVLKETLDRNPQTFKKPMKPAPKTRVRKEVSPCPFFGDYRPPKKVRPRPYVTPKMYKFLESRLKPKFRLEARIKAEEFVTRLCERVSATIKRKSKYHQYVFDIRDDMVSLGILKTQFEFHLFIEEYLPDSFRIKAIPCYGSSKGPNLDVDDLNEDLTMK